MAYIVYIELDNQSYRLPVNPEKITIKKDQEINETAVLGKGAITECGSLNALTVEFSIELPSKPYSYVLTKKQFLPANFYLDILNKCREMKMPIKFIFYSEYRILNSYFYIESMTITEKAGEEGDFYIDFNLIEATSSEIKTIEKRIDNEQYIVQHGDNLISIALKVYGDDSKVKEIMKKNNISNPNFLKAGQILKV